MVLNGRIDFIRAIEAHTYSGDPANASEIFPDILKFVEARNIEVARVTKIGGLRNAIQMMLDYPGPYLLDVIVPHESICQLCHTIKNIIIYIFSLPYHFWAPSFKSL